MDNETSLKDFFTTFCFRQELKNPQGRFTLFLEIFDALCKLSKHQRDLAERVTGHADEVFVCLFFVFNQLQDVSNSMRFLPFQLHPTWVGLDCRTSLLDIL